MKDKIVQLLNGHETLSQNLKNKIDALGALAVPALIEIMTDKSLMSEKSRGKGFIPIIAAIALAEMEEMSALKPLIDMIEYLDPLSETTIEFEACAVVLAKKNVDAILEIYASTTNDEIKGILSDILSKTEIKDERIFNIYLEQLEAGHGTSPGNLAAYQDQRAIPHLEREFDKATNGTIEAFDFHINELYHAIKKLGGSLSEERLDKYKMVTALSDKLFAPIRGLLGNIKQKIGRNELCPCESGKKYKKCCLYS